ncbi:HOG (high osmolarity glycerol) pathway protein [Savitreella phatthalungensis]
MTHSLAARVEQIPRYNEAELSRIPIADDDASFETMDGEDEDEESPELSDALELPSDSRRASKHDYWTAVPHIRDYGYAPADVRFYHPSSPHRTDPLLEICSSGETRAAQGPLPQPAIDESGAWDGKPPWLDDEDAEGSAEAEYNDDDIRGRARALYRFEPMHDNEFALEEGQVIYVSSRHGLGWLVAVDPDTGDCGLVPEEYVAFFESTTAIDDDRLDNCDSHDLSELSLDSAADSAWEDEVITKTELMELEHDPHEVSVDELGSDLANLLVALRAPRGLAESVAIRASSDNEGSKDVSSKLGE